MRQSGGGRFIRNSFRAKRPNGYDAEKAIAPAGQSSAASHASSASMGTGWRRRRAQCASRSMVKRAGRRSAHIPQETQTAASMDRVIVSSIKETCGAEDDPRAAGFVPFLFRSSRWRPMPRVFCAYRCGCRPRAPSSSHRREAASPAPS